MFLGDQLLAYLVLAMGGALLVGNVLALVKPPPATKDGELERAPVARSLVMAGIGLIAAVWAIASLLGRLTQKIPRRIAAMPPAAANASTSRRTTTAESRRASTLPTPKPIAIAAANNSVRGAPIRNGPSAKNGDEVQREEVELERPPHAIRIPVRVHAVHRDRGSREAGDDVHRRGDEPCGDGAAPPAELADAETRGQRGDAEQRHATRGDRQRAGVRAVHDADDERCDHDRGNQQAQRGAHVDVRSMGDQANGAHADRAHVDEPDTDRWPEHEHHHRCAHEGEAETRDRLRERAGSYGERRDDERIGGEVDVHDARGPGSRSASEVRAEPVDCAGEPFSDIDLGFPAELGRVPV